MSLQACSKRTLLPAIIAGSANEKARQSGALEQWSWLCHNPQRPQPTLVGACTCANIPVLLPANTVWLNDVVTYVTGLPVTYPTYKYCFPTAHVQWVLAPCDFAAANVCKHGLDSEQQAAVRPSH